MRATLLFLCLAGCGGSSEAFAPFQVIADPAPAIRACTPSAAQDRQEGDCHFEADGTLGENALNLFTIADAGGTSYLPDNLPDADHQAGVPVHFAATLRHVATPGGGSLAVHLDALSRR